MNNNNLFVKTFQWDSTTPFAAKFAIAGRKVARVAETNDGYYQLTSMQPLTKAPTTTIRLKIHNYGDGWPIGFGLITKSRKDERLSGASGQGQSQSLGYRTGTYKNQGGLNIDGVVVQEWTSNLFIEKGSELLMTFDAKITFTNLSKNRQDRFPLKAPHWHNNQIYVFVCMNSKGDCIEIMEGCQGKLKKVVERPQDLYSNIKPIAFDNHNHEKPLLYIRTDTNILKSSSIQEQYAYVSTIHQLQEMIEEISKQSQVAVDVQHSNKSYNGLTCLLQFSTRKKDYIVDVFPLWRDIPLMKKIMGNEKIIKIMHGAEMDTKWFQRDFNIHIVNLFDTYRASQVLAFPKLSYAYLLTHYCNVITDKTYQLADWRQRPLSTEMLHYARLDTHYLLEIFDRLRADLHHKALNMNLVPFQVISDIYASSFEVTKNQAQLFDFRKQQFYIHLKKDMKSRKDFLLIDKIFNILDNLARNQDVSFDQLVTQKLQRNIIPKIKEIIYHKKHNNIRIKIDNLMALLKEEQKAEIFQTIMGTITEELQKYLSDPEIDPERIQKAQQITQRRIMHIEEQKTNEEVPKNSMHQLKEFSQQTKVRKRNWLSCCCLI